jgi:hypothetical protein
MYPHIISLAEVPQARAVENQSEEVIVRLTRGRGRFSPDKRFITLSMRMYRPAATPDGYGALDGEHAGVWEAQFSSPQELFNRPNPPLPPLDEPVGPVQDVAPSAQTKAIWTFRDGSSITAVGPAMSHLIRLADNSHLFLVCCAQTITGGTGKYEGSSGLKTSMGSTHIPAGVDLFAPGTPDFEAQTIDTFRIVRARGQKKNDYSSTTPQKSVPAASDSSSISRTQGTAEIGSLKRLQLGQEYPPPDEAKWIEEITKIHLNLMKLHPAQRGPHRKANGCVAAVFTVADDIPEQYRIGIFSLPRSYLTLARFSNGGSEDDRKPDAHAMALKLTGISGKDLLKESGEATTQDFIVCDNEVFVVSDVRQMVEFEEAKAQRATFNGTDDDFAKAFPKAAFLLTRFAKSGFLKLAKGSPFASDYWSQTPSILGDGLAVKYWARPWPSNDLDRRPGTTPNYLEESMHDLLVTQRRHMYFDFLIVCQTDPVAMPVEDPMVLWPAGPDNTFRLATIDILPLPFESAQQKRFCEDLSLNPWHCIAPHRPIGGINRARRSVYATTSATRHAASHDLPPDPTPADLQRLWSVPSHLWSPS